MKERISLNLFIFILFTYLSPSILQAGDHNLIVKLSYIKGIKGCQIGEPVFEALNLYEASCEDAAFRIIKNIRTNNYMINSPVTYRNIPNDPRFNELWNFLPSPTNADVSAVKAWNISEGKMRKGEFVVAVIDGGIDVEHLDLKDNIWVNNGEIPGNFIDDDKNGYVDDVNGWNVYNNTGDIEKDNHGTHVAGIVGAKGNNGIGVTGINWKTKIMGISGSSGDTKTVLKAYNYVLNQKKLYLKSGGKLGANIVSTNSSFGVDLADCKSRDFRLWNEVYNELGKVGILNVAATINDEVNVDRDGDVPTGCDSEAIISVTNTNSDNEKYKFSGYGIKSIDLGAPGTDILSTVPGNSYSVLTGTSMATPHVAGAIAFLSALKNKKFNQIQENDPKGSAMIIKNILLNSVDKMPSLKEKTVSGGKLNLYKSTKALLSD